jgi:hypothetical protein
MACTVYRWTPERRPEIETALRAHSTRAAAAAALRITVNQLDHACVTYGLSPGRLLGSGDAVTVQAPPPSSLPIEELVADRKRRFEVKRRHEEARRLIPVTIKSAEPIGILHFGDPHVDDDGCDIALLESHARLVRETPGLYGANVGDTTNNWVGRLAKLYAEQSTSAADGWRLAEWFVGEVRDWIYMVGGNHDLWSGAGDPMRWIAGQVGAFYQDSEVRIALRFPGQREVRVNCRHDFAGRSQWNPAHGPMKAAQLGVRDHLLVAGHKHESAYGLVKDPQAGIVCHCVLVASYKVYDRYQRERGFRDQALGPAALTVIDPRLSPTHPDLVHVFWDPQEGAEFLAWKRRRRAA